MHPQRILCPFLCQHIRIIFNFKNVLRDIAHIFVLVLLYIESHRRCRWLSMLFRYCVLIFDGISVSISISIYLAGIRISADFLESVNFSAAHGVEYSVLKSLVVSFKVGEQVFHILPFRCVIFGAGGFYYRQCASAREVADVFFLRVD